MNQTGWTSPEEIVIEETQIEYLLKIPVQQKDRARGIEGRRWDPQRRRWVYPRNLRMYNALVSEFGDDLTPSSTFSRPIVLDEAENHGFQTDIAKLTESVESVSSVLSVTVQEREKTISEQQREIQDLRAQVEHLQEEATSSSSETRVAADRYEVIKEIALECLGNDPVFAGQVGKLSIDPYLPVTIAKIIESHLKHVLQPEKSEKFVDLIRSCRDSQMLDDTLIEILHIIRKQRNVVVHGNLQEGSRTRMARAIFCLFGAALVLPELPGQ